MTDITKEDFDAKFDALPGLFAEALKAAGLVPAAAAPVTEPTTSTEAVTATDTSAVTDTTHESTPVEIDFGHVVEALRDKNLPGKVAGQVISSMQKGTSLEDALAEQTALREAFVASSVESGSVHIQESDKTPHGLARAVTVLK